MFGKGLCGLLCAAAVFYALPCQAGAEEPGITQDSITIGAFGPITGPAAYIGLAGRDGATLALALGASFAALGSVMSFLRMAVPAKP